MGGRSFARFRIHDNAALYALAGLHERFRRAAMYLRFIDISGKSTCFIEVDCNSKGRRSFSMIATGSSR